MQTSKENKKRPMKILEICGKKKQTALLKRMLIVSSSNTHR
jgi:hypothetical protein